MAASPELDASSSTAAPTDSASAADQAKKHRESNKVVPQFIELVYNSTSLGLWQVYLLYSIICIDMRTYNRVLS